MYTEENDSNNQLRFENVPTEINICCFGSSHAVFSYSFELFEEDYTCFNFGMVSQSLSYDLRLLKHYKENIAEGAIVYITLSYFSLFGQDEEYEDDFEIKNQRYYSILNPWEIKNYSISQDMMVGRLQAFGAGPLQLYRVLTGNTVPAEAGTSFEARWNQRPDVDLIKKEEVFYVVEEHVGASRRDADGSLIYNETEQQALYEMIDLCREIGATPILVVTPYTVDYSQTIEEQYPAFLSEFDEVVRMIAAEKEVAYYDYSADYRFREYSLYFDDPEHIYLFYLNSDHMSKMGATEFTKILLKESAGIEV